MIEYKDLSNFVPEGEVVGLEWVEYFANELLWYVNIIKQARAHVETGMVTLGEYEDIKKYYAEEINSFIENQSPASVKYKTTFEIKNEEMKKEVDQSFVNGSVTVLDDEKLRNTGKTTYLLKKAKELNVPLIYKHKGQAEWAKQIDPSVEVLLIPNIKGYRGKRFKNGFIVDEGFSLAEINLLTQYYGKLLGGITSNNCA